MKEETESHYSTLSLSERKQIEYWIGLGGSFRQIGRALGRYHSSIAREVKRNGGREKYNSDAAHLRARKHKVNLKRRVRKIKKGKKDD